MKKVWILAAAAALAVACAGCGAGDIQTDSTGGVVSAASSTASGVQSEAPKQAEKTPADYDNNLDGMAAYLKDQGYIEKDYQAAAVMGMQAQADSNIMQAQIIGAKAGKRYVGSYDGKQNVTIELYEYDPANLDSKGQEVIAQVKQEGTFTVFGKDVEAHLSSNSKYLMVYQDTELAADKKGSKVEDHKARKQTVVEKFQAFHA